MATHLLFGRRAAIWVGLAVVSALVLFAPGVPIAVRSPVLSVVVATVSGAGGLLLLALGLLRFRALGGPLDLFTGLAFGTLAGANFGVAILGPLLGLGLEELEAGLAYVLVLRAMAASLLLVGCVRATTVLEVDRRVRWALNATAVTATIALLGAVVLSSAPDFLPSSLEPATRARLLFGEPITGGLPGQATWVLAADGTIAALLVLAMVGYGRLAVRLGDPHTGSLATVLSFLAFGQLHALAFPPLPGEYVSTADLFRVAAYAILLWSVVTRLVADLAEHGAREERVRLSRELHDGLAQHLSLLHMRLDRAASPDRSAERRREDLEAAKRLAEAALLEARQAITALRVGTLSWDEFGLTVQNFAEDFSQNHEVEVAVDFETVERAPRVTADLQAEVLRILHEAWSNAVRHGRATRVLVGIGVRHGGLDIRVRDNGRGFDVEHTLRGGGVGVRSMVERLQRRGGRLTFASPPGGGAQVQAWMPLAGQARAA